MKTIIIYIIGITFSLTAYTQSITDLFENIPDSAVQNLTKAQRKAITKYSLDNKTVEDAYADMRNHGNSYAFEVLDIKNGYLKLIGSFEGHIQMCYWNLSNGNKLIAVYQEGCGPVCYIEEFEFYQYNGKAFKPLNWQNIIPDVYNDFLANKSLKEEMKREDILATLLFDLPRTGKNIVAKWGNEDSQETYKKYGLGDRMILMWDDGKFKKGKIYWE